MRRFISVVAVMTLMTAMMVAAALPAFADQPRQALCERAAPQGELHAFPSSGYFDDYCGIGGGDPVPAE